MSSPSDFSDEKTIKLVQKSIDTDQNGSKFKRSISRFLVDFNVVSYAVAFLIAISFKDFIDGLIQLILSKFIKEDKFKVLTEFLVFIIILILCFVFVEFVFYKYIYTEDVEKESILRTAIKTKKQEEAKKEIEKEPILKKEIKKGAKINIEESFQTTHHGYPF
jgi:hypothetical protein